MPLNRQDCVDLVRELEVLLRVYDPALVEPVLHSTERYQDPRRYLVELLRTVRRFYSERSGGMHGVILDRMNHFVRLEDGSPVQGISVALTPAESELYATDEVSLAELPDRSEFLAELDQITRDIIRESELPQ